MRTVYATSLEVNDASDVSASLDYVGRWIEDWYRRQRLSVDLAAGLRSHDQSLAPAPGHALSLRHWAGQSAQELTDLIWEYPDEYDKSLGWIVRMGLLRSAAGLSLSIEISVMGLQRIVAPARFKLGSPRVIRDICRLRSIQLGDYPYNVAPERVAAEDVELLVAELDESRRSFPIVLVSRRLEDDVPLVDSLDLAERLAGVAKVYELADKWAAFRLTEEVGRPMSCFAGAVRLYWPRFNRQADPFDHPAWMPWQLKDAATAERALLSLCETVFEAAAFRHVEPAALTLVRREAERDAREAARREVETSADQLLDDLIDMEDRLKQAERSNEELVRDNESLRENLSALAQVAGRRRPEASGTASLEDVPSEAAPPTSVEAALQAAQARVSRLRFLPSALSSAAESPYRQPERVLQALLALDEVATIWAATLDSGKAGGSLRELFRKRGFDYADDVSQTAKGKWGNEYVVQYDGEELDISPHITLGAKQADTCLSIHWAWHRVDKTVLVAHVGRHKTNTRT